MKKVKITIEIPESIRTKLNRKAKKNQVSVNRLLNDFIKVYLINK